MIRESVTINDVVLYLNELLDIDKDALSRLITEKRSRCNKALADHSTVIASDEGGGVFTVGLMGILNGLFGINEFGRGVLAARFKSERGDLVGFLRRDGAASVLGEQIDELTRRHLAMELAISAMVSNETTQAAIETLQKVAAEVWIRKQGLETELAAIKLEEPNE